MFKVADLSETKPQMVPTDLNIGFEGLALSQGQIYNPDVRFLGCIIPLPTTPRPIKPSQLRHASAPFDDPF